MIIRARATVLMRLSAASRFSCLPHFLTVAAVAGARGRIELYCRTSSRKVWEGPRLGRPMVRQWKPLRVESAAHWWRAGYARPLIVTERVGVMWGEASNKGMRAADVMEEEAARVERAWLPCWTRNTMNGR